jgi:hypothetical protein
MQYSQNGLDAHRSAGQRPLWALVLAQSGQDVRRCTTCGACENLISKEVRHTLGELIQAVIRNESCALTWPIIWYADEWLLESRFRCQAGLDLISVLLVLQREAQRAGISPWGGG